MKIKDFIAIGVVSCALVNAGGAQVSHNPGQDNEHHTQAQLKQSAREAHTPEQYQALSAYYANQQKEFLQRAAHEKAEWVRRSQNVMAVSAKYPRPMDSAKYQYEYFVEKAREAGLRSANYSQLGNTTQTATVQDPM